MQTLWRHVGPLGPGVHVVAAFALLVPGAVMDAQEIKYGFVSPDEIWSSELDVLFGKNVLADGSLDFTANSTPSTMMVSAVTHVERDHLTISPEMINYVFALIVYGLRYAAVFWYGNMAFSFVFSFSQILSLLQFVFQYAGMTILYKFAVNLDAVPGLELVLNPTAAILLFLAADCLVHFSAIAVFNYGYQHYYESHRQLVKKHQPALASSMPNKMATGCQGYAPHAIATICLLLATACRSAMVYDYVMVYRRTGFSVVLGCIIVDACYMLSWIALWFAFTIKQTWRFKIQLCFDRPATMPRSTVYTIQDHIRPEPVVTDQTANGYGPADPPPQPPPTNGHAVTLETDLLEKGGQDGPDGPHSPTSVLRKSGERRNNPQRVKFHDTGEPKNNDGIKPKRKRRKKSGKKETDPEKLALAESGTAVDQAEPGSATPDNTLTRHYRHSIRDKCGQYYRVAPAAQSSPRTRPLSDSFTCSQAADAFAPLHIKIQEPGSRTSSSSNHPPQIQSQQQQSPPDGADAKTNKPSVLQRPGEHLLQRGLPPSLVAKKPECIQLQPYADLPPLGPLSGDVPPRLRSGRGSLRKPNDTRHSYPPPISPKPQQQQQVAVVDNTQTQRTPTKLQYVHKASLSQDSAHGSSQSGSVSQHDLSLSSAAYPTTVYNEGGVPRLISKPTPPPPHSGRNLNRELRIVKPDLKRRDSALPSSNETSSNDSGENVLCSQV